MADTLVAKANIGAGTDQLAVDNVPGGAAGVVKVALGAAGAVDGYLSTASPMPIQGVFAEDSQHVSGDRGMHVMGVRQDADVAPGADGDYVPFLMNAVGRLKVSALPAATTNGSGAITASAQTIVVDVSRESNVLVDLSSGTFVGHNSTFEVSLDGVVWKACLMVRSNTATTVAESTTGVLGAAPAYSWEASVNGYSQFRVRCTAHTSGTANYVIGFGAFATEPLPAAAVSGTQPVSGTVTATVANATLAASTAIVGDVGVVARANATGAATGLKVLAAASTNATSVKASAGRLLGYQLMNNGVATAYVKLHNIATAPTVGTTPVAVIIAIPPANTATFSLACGVAFTTGIGMSIVGGAADNDTTAVAANQVAGHLIFA